MSTTATVAKLKAANQIQVNDTTRRFGYSAGVPYLSVNPKYSGLPAKEVPGGRLLTFITEIETVVGAYNEQKKLYPHIPRQITPKEQVFYVAKKFHVGMDAGFRELESMTKLPYGLVEEIKDPATGQVLRPEQYFDEGTLYFDVVHPPLLEACPFGLESQFVSHAEGNTGAEWFQACPTCRLAELESQECSARIAQSSLDRLTLDKLRQELINACRAAIVFAETRIALIDADLEKRAHGEHGRSHRWEVDYIYLKMAHREAPAAVKPMSQADIVSQAAQAAATGVFSAMNAAQAAPAVVEAPAAVPEDAVVLTGDDKAAYEKWQAKKAQLEQARATKQEKNDGSNDTAGAEGED